MAEANSNAGRRAFLWIGAAVILIAVFFTARFLLRERLPVRGVEVRREVIVNTISTNGRVEPEANYQFYSPLATTVKSVSVLPGDKIPAGKLMIELDGVEAQARVASAESAVKAAQSMLDATKNNGTQAERQSAAAEITQDKLVSDQARHDVDALTKLVATGAASTSELAAAKQRLATADASLHAAQQNAHNRYSPDEIARAQAALDEARAGLAAAQHVEAQTRIVAPIAGTVYSLDAAPSQFAEQGKLLLQMADLRHERIRAYFDEPDIGRLAVGQKVAIRWDAKPGEEWHGTIDRLPASVSTFTTRIVGEVLIALDESDSGLLPETNVTVQVAVSSQPNALSMPREALHSENSKYYVYKIVNGELKRTNVTIGAPTLTQVPILTGLVEGDWIATGTTNGQPLQEDMPVKVRR